MLSCLRLPSRIQDPQTSAAPRRRDRRGGALPLLALAILLAAALSPSRAHAQAGIQGIVTDARTTQPLTGASVDVEQAGEELRSARTDANGLFRIPSLPAGAYQLRIVAFGYLEHAEAITLSAGQTITANRGLTPDPLQLEGVSFAAPAGGAVRRELGRQTITIQDMARVPTPVAGDIIGYLQTVPGVVTTGDRGGQLLVRGGTPSENMVLMDGILVYQPFHITGFASVFPQDLVGSAEFYPGGYPARYSGRVSSVLDVRMRDGNRNERSVAGSLSPFVAEVTAEGPLREGGPYSLIVSARRSLIEETSPWLLGEEQPLRFSSYYMKLSSIAEEGDSRCSVTALRSNDSGGLDPGQPASRVGWTNSLLGGRCTSLTGELFIDVRFGLSHVANEAITRGASELSSTAHRGYIEADVSRSIGGLQVEFGGYGRFEDSTNDLAEIFSQNRELDGIMGVGLYAETTLPIGQRLRLLPGVTTNVYVATYRPTFEPRLRASWQPFGRTEEELSGAVGVYTQPTAGIADRRDAGSIFTAWGRPVGDDQIRALHAQMSWQQSLGAGLSWSVDGYYRRTQNLPVTTWSTVATFNTQLVSAEGRSHGADGRVEYRRGPFYGFASYGYGWTRYEAMQEDFGIRFGEPVQHYHPSHDRRHQVNALSSLRLGGYTIAAHWEYGSGFPFTRPLGFEELFDFRNELPEVDRQYGQTRVLLDRPYNGRLPPVHRLDVSLERSLDVRGRQLQLQAGVINAYGQTNMFYYDVFTSRRIDQLPFAPYLSLKLAPKGSARP